MAKKKKKHLTKKEIENFKEQLLEKRNEILGDVLDIEDSSLKKEKTELSVMPIHMADAGSDNYDLDNSLGLMEGERKLLVEINDALERIEEGTYGICEGSGKPIPKARLEAIPWARYSVQYAEKIEKGQVKEEENYNKYDFAPGIDDEEEEEEQ